MMAPAASTAAATAANAQPPLAGAANAAPTSQRPKLSAAAVSLLQIHLRHSGTDATVPSEHNLAATNNSHISNHRSVRAARNTLQSLSSLREHISTLQHQLKDLIDVAGLRQHRWAAYASQIPQERRSAPPAAPAAATAAAASSNKQRAKQAPRPPSAAATATTSRASVRMQRAPLSGGDANASHAAAAAVSDFAAHDALPAPRVPPHRRFRDIAATEMTVAAGWALEAAAASNGGEQQQQQTAQEHARHASCPTLPSHPPDLPRSPSGSRSPPAPAPAPRRRSSSIFTFEYPIARRTKNNERRGTAAGAEDGATAAAGI
jgi:hypothetical protein